MSSSFVWQLSCTMSTPRPLNYWRTERKPGVQVKKFGVLRKPKLPISWRSFEIIGVNTPKRRLMWPLDFTIPDIGLKTCMHNEKIWPIIPQKIQLDMYNSQPVISTSAINRYSSSMENCPLLIFSGRYLYDIQNISSPYTHLDSLEISFGHLQNSRRRSSPNLKILAKNCNFRRNLVTMIWLL